MHYLRDLCLQKIAYKKNVTTLEIAVLFTEQLLEPWQGNKLLHDNCKYTVQNTKVHYPGYFYKQLTNLTKV